MLAEHRTACLDEVNKLKTGGTEGAQEFKATNVGSEMPACTATLSLSGDCLIIIWPWFNWWHEHFYYMFATILLIIKL